MSWSQLRYLQTLNSIAAEKNSTIIFPVPLELFRTSKLGSPIRTPQPTHFDIHQTESEKERMREEKIVSDEARRQQGVDDAAMIHESFGWFFDLKMLKNVMECSMRLKLTSWKSNMLVKNKKMDESWSTMIYNAHQLFKKIIYLKNWNLHILNLFTHTNKQTYI